MFGNIFCPCKYLILLYLGFTVNSRPLAENTQKGIIIKEVSPTKTGSNIAQGESSQDTGI
jgi:hypothetical protein